MPLAVARKYARHLQTRIAKYICSDNDSKRHCVQTRENNTQQHHNSGRTYDGDKDFWNGDR